MRSGGLGVVLATVLLTNLGDRRGGLQRLHGDEAVNGFLHSAMAAVLMAQLTSRLLVAPLVLGVLPLRRGAACRQELHADMAATYCELGVAASVADLVLCSWICHCQ